jgi:hypothetical protein
MAQSVCETTAQDIFNGKNGEIFQREYDGYVINKTLLEAADFQSFSVKVVLGDWCEDSQMQVPRFMKIMNGFPPFGDIEIHYYLVDENKFCADPEIQQLNFRYVPAFIFFRGGQEIGRIIETPDGLMEAHISRIIR